MENKVCNIMYILFGGTIIYYILGNRIKLIKNKKTTMEKMLTSFYYSTQVTTTLGLLNVPSDLLVMFVINIHVLIVFYITSLM